MSDPFLAAGGLTVRFGGLVALNDVSLEVDEGEIVGLIGPNGAGKTTCFAALLGLVPASGWVRLAGHDVSSWPAHRRVRTGVARTFQKLEVFGSMTVRENLLYATEASALGRRPWRMLAGGRDQDPAEVDATIEQLGLGPVADLPAGDLPLGTGRLVELGRALCTRPRMLLLDEPSSGLDAAETAHLGQRLAEVVDRRGLGVLLVEHDMSLVTALCQRLYVIEFGRPIAQGLTDEVIHSPEVRRAYLGAAVSA